MCIKSVYSHFLGHDLPCDFSPKLRQLEAEQTTVTNLLLFLEHLCAPVPFTSHSIFITAYLQHDLMIDYFC